METEHILWLLPCGHRSDQWAIQPALFVHRPSLTKSAGSRHTIFPAIFHLHRAYVCRIRWRVGLRTGMKYQPVVYTQFTLQRLVIWLRCMTSIRKKKNDWQRCETTVLRYMPVPCRAGSIIGLEKLRSIHDSLALHRHVFIEALNRLHKNS